MKLLSCGFVVRRLWQTALLRAMLHGFLISIAFAQINLKQVALLGWYPANVSASIQVTDSLAMASDGANIWVSDGYQGTVKKFRASDGAAFC